MGIDPGLARVGYGAVVQSGSDLKALNYGCVETKPGMNFSDRLLTIYNDIQEQIDVCSPDFLSVERLFFGRNLKTAGNVYQARGVIMLLAAKNKLPVIEPMPNQIKMKLCGIRNADKAQVQGMVQKLLALEAVPKPDDTADALAAAVTGLAVYAST